MARHPKSEFFGHFIWATWDRLPLITPEIREPIFQILRAKCAQLGCHEPVLLPIVDIIPASTDRVPITVKEMGPYEPIIDLQIIRFTFYKLVIYAIEAKLRPRILPVVN